jgi:hypothetical protein
MTPSGYRVVRTEEYLLCADRDHPAATLLWGAAVRTAAEARDRCCATEDRAAERAEQLADAFDPDSLTWDYRPAALRDPRAGRG